MDSGVRVFNHDKAFEVVELLEPRDGEGVIHTVSRYISDDLDGTLEFARGLAAPHSVAMWRRTPNFDADLGRVKEYMAEVQARWPEPIRAALLLDR